MSLTSFITKKEVRKMFKEEFEKPRLPYNKDILAEPLTNNYSLVGIAFDYLFRSYLQYINFDRTVSSSWVCENALYFADNKQNLREELKLIINDAKEKHSEFTTSGILTDSFIESLLRISQLDYTYRAGILPDDYGLILSEDIRDIRNLYDIMIKRNWKAEKICLLNPTFGIGSSLVGGADADAIIDDTIIELKTIKTQGISRETYNQLLGYYILSNINSVNNTRRPKINKIACYSSRYGELFVYDINDIISVDTFDNFKNNFKNLASKEFQL